MGGGIWEVVTICDQVGHGGAISFPFSFGVKFGVGGFGGEADGGFGWIFGAIHEFADGIDDGEDLVVVVLQFGGSSSSSFAASWWWEERS